MVLAIDPIIDMARTLINMSGTITEAVATDCEMEAMDMTLFNNPVVRLEYDE